jgi:hypothetical protein
MADGVNRIVPPSISLDRTPARGRERGRKNKGDDRKKTSETSVGAVAPMASVAAEAGRAEADKNKGKNLDIKA